MNLTHCQICGRAIKAAKGVIAHHGYKRPGHGWQTSSCFGAQYRPYEVACDRIQAAIDSAQEFKARREQQYAELTTNPPETLTTWVHRGTYRKSEPLEVTRPEGFDPTRLTRWLDYRPNSYATTWDGLVRNAKADARAAAEQIEFLQARLAAWKAPTREEVMQ